MAAAAAAAAPSPARGAAAGGRGRSASLGAARDGRTGRSVSASEAPSESDDWKPPAVNNIKPRYSPEEGIREWTAGQV